MHSLQSLRKRLRSVCLFLGVAVTFCFSSSYSSVVIFDLGETLLSVDRLKMAWELGLFDALTYTVFDNQPIHELVDRLFDVMHSEDPSPNPSRACDPQGRKLPRLMCSWLMGKCSSDTLRARLHARIATLSKSRYFVSDREKRLIGKAVDILFTPESFVELMYPIKSACALLKKCYDAGHTIVIASNWDPASSELLFSQKDLQMKIFRFVDKKHIFVSGTVQHAKPDKQFFNHLLEQGKFDPTDCILIDDQKENIEAAKQHKIAGIQVRNANYKAVEKALKKKRFLN